MLVIARRKDTVHNMSLADVTGRQAFIFGLRAPATADFFACGAILRNFKCRWSLSWYCGCHAGLPAAMTLSVCNYRHFLRLILSSSFGQGIRCALRCKVGIMGYVVDMLPYIAPPFTLLLESAGSLSG